MDIGSFVNGNVLVLVGVCVLVLIIRLMKQTRSRKNSRKKAPQAPGKPILTISMAYLIKHTFQGTKPRPSDYFLDGHKVHFYRCDTLKDMEKKGSIERYQSEAKFMNTHLIHIGNEEMRVRLPLCQRCLYILFDKAGDRPADIHLAVQYGDAKKLKECVRAFYDKDTSATGKVEEFTQAYRHAAANKTLPQDEIH